MNIDELAKIGYEGYADQTGGKTFDGRQMPKWSELPPHTTNAWRAAAQAIVDEAMRRLHLGGAQ